MVPEDASPDRGRTNESPSVRAVRGIAAYANEEPQRLTPLAESLDPDALDRLVESLSEGAVTFVHAGYLVRLDTDGEVSVEPVGSTDSPWGGD